MSLIERPCGRRVPRLKEHSTNPLPEKVLLQLCNQLAAEAPTLDMGRDTHFLQVKVPAVYPSLTPAKSERVWQRVLDVTKTKERRVLGKRVKAFSDRLE